MIAENAPNEATDHPIDARSGSASGDEPGGLTEEAGPSVIAKNAPNEAIAERIGCNHECADYVFRGFDQSLWSVPLVLKLAA